MSRSDPQIPQIPPKYPLPAVGNFCVAFAGGQVGNTLVSGGMDKGIWDKGMSAFPNSHVPQFPCPSVAARQFESN
jgi:hypothetical protein